MLNSRDLALVLSALRHWQQSHSGLITNDALRNIASDGSKFEPLGPDEIDQLCERLNTIRHAAARFVLYDFDADELATTLIYSSYESAKQDADQLSNVVILQLPRPGQDSGSVCECQEPGSYLYSGVPGILAHMGAGGVATGSKVFRCEHCQRYPTDEAALAKLKELGLA